MRVPPSDGGSTFLENPDRRADDARLVWSAEVDPSVLNVSARQPSAGCGPSFDLDAFGRRALVASGGGTEHVAIGGLRSTLRLDVIEGTVCAGPVLLTAHLVGLSDLEPKLSAVRRLAALCRHGTAADPVLRPEPRLKRLVLALRVLDALAERNSLRDIAAGLLGDEEVSRSWPGRGESMKSLVRRLAALARALELAGPVGILRRRI